MFPRPVSSGAVFIHRFVGTVATGIGVAIKMDCEDVALNIVSDIRLILAYIASKQLSIVNPGDVVT